MVEAALFTTQEETERLLYERQAGASSAVAPPHISVAGRTTLTMATTTWTATVVLLARPATRTRLPSATS